MSSSSNVSPLDIQENPNLVRKASSLTFDGRTNVCDDQSTLGSRNITPQYYSDTDTVSPFIFLNPRWLVACVGCILRHDLSREIYEVRRSLLKPETAYTKNLSWNDGRYHERELKTDVNYPVISARDACLLWDAKRYTRKAAERALQYSNDRSVTPFDFLQRLLVRFGIFIPIDLLGLEKVDLGGRDYSRFSGYPDVSSDVVDSEEEAPKVRL